MDITKAINDLGKDVVIAALKRARIGKQEKVLLAYTAGLIDGEGNIGAAGENLAGLTLAISNTYKPVLDKLQDCFGGKVYACKSRNSSLCTSTKTLYRWHICGQQAEQLLRACFPYLVIKKEAAKLLFDMRSGVSHGNNSGRKLPTSEYDRRRKLWDRIKQLNH